MAEPSIESPPVRVVLMGGIGSGKSTVGRILAGFGAVVIDADRIGHYVLEAGRPAYSAVAARWPSVVVDGAIDRSRLASIVFEDVDELRELEAITHPAIADEITRRVAAAGSADVVVEIPLTRRLLGDGWIRVLVDASEDVRTRRVIDRGAAPSDVARRMAAQPDREQWLDAADIVIDNDGDLDQLSRGVAAVWSSLGGRIDVEQGPARYRSPADPTPVTQEETPATEEEEYHDVAE